MSKRIFIGAFLALIVTQVAVLGTSGVDRVHGAGPLVPNMDGASGAQGGLFQ